MKKFKKASTFGQKDEWWILFDQIKSVYNELEYYQDVGDEEDVEAVILILEKLGYLEFE